MTKCLNAQETEVQIFTDRSRNSAEGGLRSPVVANIQPTQTETLAANMQLVQKTLAGQGPVYKPSSRTSKVIDGGPSTGSPRADESFGDDLVESTDLFSVESLQARRRDKGFIVLLGYAGGILVSVMADTGGLYPLYFYKGCSGGGLEAQRKFEVLCENCRWTAAADPWNISL